MAEHNHQLPTPPDWLSDAEAFDYAELGCEACHARIAKFLRPRSGSIRDAGRLNVER